MGLKTWNNGEKGEVVQKIIDNNFRTVGRYLTKNILCLSTSERNTLTSDYISNGLIVYDTDLEQWFEYKNNRWEIKPITEVYSKDITVNDWVENKIYIPYLEHLKTDPIVQLLILEDGLYYPVYGGVEIDMAYDITLSTDTLFNGRIVIK